jgi:hypothetical protein
VSIVVKEFLVLNGMDVESANCPAGMGQYVVFPPRGGRGEGGSNESHKAELLLKVFMVSVVASVKRVERLVLLAEDATICWEAFPKIVIFNVCPLIICEYTVSTESFCDALPEKQS